MAITVLSVFAYDLFCIALCLWITNKHVNLWSEHPVSDEEAANDKSKVRSASSNISDGRVRELGAVLVRP